MKDDLHIELVYLDQSNRSILKEREVIRLIHYTSRIIRREYKMSLKKYHFKFIKISFIFFYPDIFQSLFHSLI